VSELMVTMMTRSHCLSIIIIIIIIILLKYVIFVSHTFWFLNDHCKK